MNQSSVKGDKFLVRAIKAVSVAATLRPASAQPPERTEVREDGEHCRDAT